MDTGGRLGKERLTIAGRESAAGDRVVCLRNSDLLGVKNGTSGTVESVDRDQRTILFAADREPTVELSRRYLEADHIRHAYALTGHAAQGLTAERAFVLGGGEARLQEWGYVALFRARTETRLYVTGTAREHNSHFHDQDNRTRSPASVARSRNQRSSGLPSTNDPCRPARDMRRARKSGDRV